MIHSRWAVIIYTYIPNIQSYTTPHLIRSGHKFQIIASQHHALSPKVRSILMTAVTVALRFIERFLRDKDWWWLVLSRKVSPDRFTYGTVCECIVGNTFFKKIWYFSFKFYSKMYRKIKGNLDWNGRWYIFSYKINCWYIFHGYIFSVVLYKVYFILL